MLSSYELLELLENMDERGRFKTAARGGEWSEEQAMWAHMANETAKLRATIQVVHGGKDAAYSPKVFLSVSERLDMVQEEEAMEDLRDSVFDFASFDTIPSPVASEDFDEDLFLPAVQ